LRARSRRETMGWKPSVGDKVREEENGSLKKGVVEREA